MASSQDSLSQSMLAPDVSSCQLEKAAEILDDVEAKQSKIQNKVIKKTAAPNSVCIATLDSTKGNLVTVNQILQAEKQLISELRTSYSQSQSQIEYSDSQNRMKNKASALLYQQRRLLNAFKNQKAILDLLKQEENTTRIPLTNTAEAARTVEATRNTSINETPERLLEKTDKISSSNSFKVIESVVQPLDDNGNLNSRSQASKTDQIASKSLSEQTRINTKKVSTPRTSNRHQGCNSKNIPMRVDKQARKTSRQNLPNGKSNEITGTSSISRSQISHTTAVSKKEVAAVLTVNTTNGARSSADLDKTMKFNCESMYIPNSNLGDVLPSLRRSIPGSSTEHIDILKLNFVVTMKDEEFLDSSEFLPKNFWTSKSFDSVAIDEEFLKRVDFL